MKKAKTVFVCSDCGNEFNKWQGQCPACGAWNTLYEQKVSEVSETDSRRRSSAAKERRAAKPQKISELRADVNDRIDTGLKELNRVLGGGLVKGSLTLISGEPGIGKSTIILQAASNIAKSSGSVLYASGEESEQQIRMRAERICPNAEDVFLLSETNIEVILDAARNMKPALLVVDSIQTMYSEELDSAPGSVSQVRQCGNLLMTLAKTEGIPVFIVAHVTKSGELAGPKIVEHLVDTVLYFSGERTSDLRILRAVKNRFGTTSEIGAFEMREEGLVEIENISAAFLDGMGEAASGSVCAAVYEGTRPLLLEVQALTSTCNVGFAMRRSVGIDSNRLGMIIAVLERKAGLKLFNRDIYVNVVGGFKPEGTSTDLATALAIWSEEKGIVIPKTTLAVGELGLAGEVRAVQNCEKLIKEAERMGFTEVILPKRNLDKLRGSFNIKLTGVSKITELLK